MSFNLTALVHSAVLKDFAIHVLAAAKQLSDEGAAVAASGQPIIGPAIAVAEPLADAFFDALIARVQHLEQNQEAKAQAVAAVAAPAPSAPAAA